MIDEPFDDLTDDTVTEVEVLKIRAWTVVLHNDDVTPMDIVTFLLQQVFGLEGEAAQMVMMKVHVEGKVSIGTYSRDIAETKASQIMEGAIKLGGFPLRAEAAPVE